MVGLFQNFSEIIFFSRIRCRCLSRERVFFVNRLVSLKRRLTSGDSTVAIEISRLESELKALISRELEGSKVRSRVRWFEDGERQVSETWLQKLPPGLHLGGQGWI